ncbi:MAG: hypothetical protein ACTHLE_01525 [Agriterribacter sp.]
MAETLNYTDLIQEARNAEARNASAEAIKHYNRALRLLPLHPHAYHRLMVIYRKSRNYAKELAIINKAISRFDKAFRFSKRSKLPAQSLRLSKNLAKTLGLLDKKGNSAYQPEPIATWHRRKSAVLKRISKRR